MSKIKIPKLKKGSYSHTTGNGTEVYNASYYDVLEVTKFIERVKPLLNEKPKDIKMSPAQLSFIIACTDYLKTVDETKCQLDLSCDQYTLKATNFKACLRGVTNIKGLVIDVYPTGGVPRRIHGINGFREFLSEMSYCSITQYAHY